MRLEVKRPDRIVPEYSLTGDLLSFKSCEMQYRYYNGSSLPPSRPVQMWYGEFIHGVLETALRLWQADGYAFPWPYTRVEAGTMPAPPDFGLARNDLRVFAWPIEQALKQQGKRARSGAARLAAYNRAWTAINMLGPHLFPLVSSAEEKVIGTRELPPRNGGAAFRSDKYVLTGVIDVLTNIELAGAARGNIISDAVQAVCGQAQGAFEVVVDYKGSHRPDIAGADNHWELGEWQVQTYAWLRGRQPEATPVAAGILIYLNELAPGSSDIPRLKKQIADGSTDVVPVAGDADDYAIRAWVPGTVVRLSDAFRLRRAIRVVPVDDVSIARATTAFDETVASIEGHVVDEATCGSISRTWLPTSNEPQTCAACDFYPFCSNPARGADRANAGFDEP